MRTISTNIQFVISIASVNLECASKVKNKKLSDPTYKAIANLINFIRREFEANNFIKDLKKFIISLRRVLIILQLIRSP